MERATLPWALLTPPKDSRSASAVLIGFSGEDDGGCPKPLNSGSEELGSGCCSLLFELSLVVHLTIKELEAARGLQRECWREIERTMFVAFIENVAAIVCSVHDRYDGELN